MAEYIVELITEPTGEAMDSLWRGELIQRLPAMSAMSGLSQDGHLGVWFDVEAPDLVAAIRDAVDIFCGVADEIGGADFRFRKITAGRPDEFDD